MCPSTKLSQLTHPQRVRFLYKSILQLHRALPPELAELGNQCVREEFRKHQNCPPEFVGPFMIEWSKYAVDLSKQVRDMPRTSTVSEAGQSAKILGKSLDDSKLRQFSDAQIVQLLALAKEIHSDESDS